MIPGFPEIGKRELQDFRESEDLITLVFPLEKQRVRTFFSHEILSPQEICRLKKFQFESDQLGFLAGRGLLRSVLHAWTGLPRVDLRLGPQGKPFCHHVDAPYFNLSHGGGTLVLSLCQSVELGVDVESQHRDLPYTALAKRYYSEAEQVGVWDEGKEAFLKIWTRKEARLKASGHGLTVDVKAVDTTCADGWQYVDLAPGAGLHGCIAYEGEARKMRVFHATSV
ncbi:4'-phosphopantetheinyl transferase superfamily protein [Kiritimatiellota bacterium B12222]|nr:4'-phosphopantetheinyl transferase superfamily protein [Kiritimatiellota bacterium B12222]